MGAPEQRLCALSMLWMHVQIVLWNEGTQQFRANKSSIFCRSSIGKIMIISRLWFFIVFRLCHFHFSIVLHFLNSVESCVVLCIKKPQKSSLNLEGIKLWSRQDVPGWLLQDLPYSVMPRFRQPKFAHIPCFQPYVCWFCSFRSIWLKGNKRQRENVSLTFTSFQSPSNNKNNLH